MGYHTTYTLTSDDWKEGDYIDELVARQGFNRDFFTGRDSRTWYDHDDDMAALSLKHPGVTFRLDGEGEGSSDVWVKWYRNGEQRTWRLEVAVPGGFTPPQGW